MKVYPAWKRGKCFANNQAENDSISDRRYHFKSQNCLKSCIFPKEIIFNMKLIFVNFLPLIWQRDLKENIVIQFLKRLRHVNLAKNLNEKDSRTILNHIFNVDKRETNALSHYE